MRSLFVRAASTEQGKSLFTSTAGIWTMRDMEREDEKSFGDEILAEVETFGHVELAPQVGERMGWQPGTELMGSKVGELLILRQFRPKCCICGSKEMLKEIRDVFLCQRCIDAADAQPFYPKYRDI